MQTLKKSAPTHIDSIFSATDKYDGFMIDLWGVIHDGAELYPDVIDTLKKMKNKKIIFLSNAPRRKTVAEEKLNKLGIAKELFQDVVTSGEAAFDFLKTQKDFKRNYYYIGPSRDEGLTNGIDYTRVQAAKDAGVVIVTGFDEDDSPEDEKLPELKECIKYNLPLICSNPDIVIVRRDGTRAWCSGVIAKQYEDLGGKVIYFGKPYNDVYERSAKLLELPKNKILAIGDNPDTDIKGAMNFGIDSLLITGGILEEELGKNLSDAVITKACEKYGITPNYFTHAFK